MDIWIVVYKKNNPHLQRKYQTYESRGNALLKSVDYASESGFRLEKVLLLSTVSKEVTEYELFVDNGKIDLQTKNS